MTTGAGLPGAPLKLSPPLLLNTLDDVLKHVSLAARTAVAVPSSIEKSQLRPPSCKLAANLLKDDHGVPQTNNLKFDVAAHVLKRRHQGRETYSPSGEDSV